MVYYHSKLNRGDFSYKVILYLPFLLRQVESPRSLPPRKGWRDLSGVNDSWMERNRGTVRERFINVSQEGRWDPLTIIIRVEYLLLMV